MKVAISIPDSLFEDAEALARDLKMSRSELYSRAIASLVDRLSRERVRERLDQVYGGADRGGDPELERMALEDLPEERW